MTYGIRRTSGTPRPWADRRLGTGSTSIAATSIVGLDARHPAPSISPTTASGWPHIDGVDQVDAVDPEVRELGGVDLAAEVRELDSIDLVSSARRQAC